MDIKNGKTAFLVLDCENDMLDEKGGAAGFGIPAHAKEIDLINNVKRMLDKTREIGIDVIFVKVENKKDHSDLANSKLPIHQAIKNGPPMNIKGTWGTEIPEKIKPKEDEPVFIKSMISPFTIPEFTKTIKKYSTLIIAGVATNFVVESTVREAADREYEVIVLKDCCATMNQEMQEQSLNIMQNFARISTSKEICNEVDL